jgi:hypothetical protein
VPGEKVVVQVFVCVLMVVFVLMVMLVRHQNISLVSFFRKP